MSFVWIKFDGQTKPQSMQAVTCCEPVPSPDWFGWLWHSAL